MLRRSAAAAAKDTNACRREAGGVGSELLRRAVVHRLPLHRLGQARVGLGNERDGGVGGKAAHLLQHLRRAGGAVQPEGVHPHALHDDQGGQHVGAREGAAVLVAGKGDPHRPIRHALAGQYRRPGLGHGHGGLNEEEVHPRRRQGSRLLGIDGHQLLKAALPEGGDEQPRGGHVPRHQSAAAGSLPGQLHQPAVVVRHLPEDTVLLQPHPVGPEGGGDQHLAARRHITPLELQQGLRVAEHPLLRVRAGGHAPLIQLGAGGSVQQDGQG